MAGHETDDVGSPVVGGEENGIERHHFLHGDGVVLGSCVTIGRIEEDARNRGQNYGWIDYKWEVDGWRGEPGMRLVAIVLEGSLFLYRGNLGACGGGELGRMA